MLSEELRDFFFLNGSDKGCTIFPATYFLCLAKGGNEIRGKSRKREVGRRKKCS